MTSPPYATQREYDASSGFIPVPPDEYVEWFDAVAAGVESILTLDGPYFLSTPTTGNATVKLVWVVFLV